VRSRIIPDEKNKLARIRRRVGERRDGAMGWREDSRRRRSAGGATEAVTFDLTHTLIHAPRMGQIYGEVLKRHGLISRARDLRREISWVWKELSCLADPRRDRFTAHPDGARGFWYRFLARLCQRLEVGKPSRFAAAELFDRFGKAAAWELYPDVEPTLRALRAAGLRLGLVSNWDHRLPTLLADLGLDRYFEAVEYSSGCGYEKPHPRIFQRCLETLGVPPERALHVGDAAIEDVEGALAVGMRALRIERQEGHAPQSCHLRQLIEPMLQNGTALPVVELPVADGGVEAGVDDADRTVQR
jgi:putative hydrolase of the HAD superfamily